MFVVRKVIGRVDQCISTSSSHQFAGGFHSEHTKEKSGLEIKYLKIPQAAKGKEICTAIKFQAMNTSGHLVFSSFVDAEEEIRNYEIKNICSYSIFRRNKGFTQALSELDLTSYRLSWEDKKEGCTIEYSGVPFINLGYDVRECQFGPDRNKANKAKHANKRDSQSITDHSYTTKGRRLIQPTKKVGCPSRIWLKRILRFPNFTITGNVSEWKRKKLSKTFHKSPSLINTVEEFHVFLPTVDSHAGHILGQFASLAQPVDSRVKAKIAHLVDEGVSKVSEMKRHIQIFSKNELLPSNETSSISRRFHPTDKDVRNYMALYKQKSRFSSNDQENLKQKIRQWRDTFPDDNFYLRTSQEGQFLFVQQTQWQRRLLGLYGNDICLLDATYKTSKFNLPLFFICVCTNVGYSVVGSFITSDEKKTSIMEGLSFIKGWSNEWHPSYFITDYDNSEIGALEEIFSGCTVLICDFHREQAWMRWLKKVKSQEDRDYTLSLMRKVAHSSTEADYKSNLSLLKNCSVWKKDEKFRGWFHHTWISQEKRWVKRHRKDWFHTRVATTNGLERQHRKLKEDFLSQTSEKSLSNLVSVIVNQFCPSSYDRYVEYNVKSTENYKVYDPSIPIFLRNKPKMLVTHCLNRLPPKVEPIPENNISQLPNGEFHVKSIDSGMVYIVKLEQSLPNCSCPDWTRHKLPCKHMLAIFKHFPAWDWDFLPDVFRCCPHFNLDPELNTVCKLRPDCSEHSANFLMDDPEKPTCSISPPLPPRDNCSRKIIKCKELLKHIESSMYNMTHDDLSIAQERLEILSSDFQEDQPKEDGLPILKKPTKQKRKWNKSPLKQKKQKVWQGVINMDSMSHRLHVSECNDTLSVKQEVSKMWMQGESTHYIVSKCAGINITDEDIISLRGDGWLTDQVMDAYIGALVQAEVDKGRKILQIVSGTMTSILDGHCESNMTLTSTKIADYDCIVGAYLQGRSHWDLMVIEPHARRLTLYNPLGESQRQQRIMQQNWCRFYERRMQLHLEPFSTGDSWAVTNRMHAKQKDSFNCGVYVLMFCDRHFSGESVCDISHTDLRIYRERIAFTLMMYQVYLLDCCPCCGFEVQDFDDKVICTQCSRKFHQKSYCIGETERAESFICRQCIIDSSIEIPEEDKSSLKVKDSSSTSVSLDNLADRYVTTSDDLTKIFRENLITKNFSEEACQSMMDSLRFLSSDDRILTARKILEIVPVLPNHFQTCFKGLKVLGVHGDGLIDLLPNSVLKSGVYPLSVGESADDSLFRACSILLWGNAEKSHFLKLVIICSEILECFTGKNYCELIEREICNSLSESDRTTIREMHLRTLAEITKRRTILTGRGIKLTSFQPKNTSSSISLNLPLVAVHMGVNGEEFILPLVDGCLIGRGDRFKKKCYAEELGVCQGGKETSTMVECTRCIQSYHLHCLTYKELNGPLLCGCHVKRPYMSKDELFYKNEEKIYTLLSEIDLESFLKEIESEKIPSMRFNAFKGSNFRERQKWIDLNNSVMVFTEKMGISLVKRVGKMLNCCPEDVINIYLPEIAIYLVMRQEGLNRVQAELFLYEHSF